MQKNQAIDSTAKEDQGEVEKATKITQILQRADGSEAKIVAQTMFGAGLHPSVDVTVFRRPGPGQNWHLCNDRPAANWRQMSVDQYISEGRSEALRTVRPGEILRAVALLGEPMTRFSSSVQA